MKQQRWEQSGNRKSEKKEDQRRARKKKEDQRRERVSRKKIKARQKGRNAAKRCVFPMFLGLRRVEVALLMRRVRSHLQGWEIKKIKPLWREADLEAKMPKTLQLLEVDMWKKWTPLWLEAHVEVKTYKTHHVRSSFGS